MIVFTGHNRLERGDGIVQWHLNAVGTGKDFCHIEGLRQEALDFAGAGHGQFVLFAQFVHAKDGDDILKRLVALKHLLHVGRNLVMLFPDDGRVQQTRGRIKRVHGGIDAKLRNRTRQNGRCVQVGKGRGRRRVGQVIRGYVDRLHRGDRTGFGRCDALLQRAHVGRQRRLVAHSGRDTTKQSGHFGTGLGEAEDVIHEEQNVGPRLVAELFGQCQTRQRHTHTRTRRLVHLAVNQRHLGLRQIVGNDNARVNHLMVKVVTFTGPFTDTGKNREARVHFCDIVDQFHNQNRLTHTGTTEQTDFTAFGIGGQQVDHLDTGHQHHGFGRLFREFGRRRVDRAVLFRRDGAFLVDRIAGYVQNAAKCCVSDGHHDRAAGVADVLSAHQTFGGVHGDGAYGAFPKVLGHFQNQFLAIVVSGQCVEDLRQLIPELHVHNGADHLRDFAFCVCHVSSPVP